MSYILFEAPDGLIDGECTEAGFEKWIAVDSYSWGASRTVGMAGGTQSSSARGQGNAELAEFNFTTQMQKSSTKLALLLSNGLVLPKVEFKMVRSGGDSAKSREAYSSWTFEDVLITSYSTSGGRDMVPIENWGFSFLKINHELKVTDQKTGALSTGGTYTWKVDSGDMG